jgi:aryl-alcohol dehydrogenase-like predicted oxidoreductase
MMKQLGTTDLNVFPLCLGGNVFGWTANEKESFRILDAYLDAGGNFIDTADQYSAWAPGLHGGESETIIGNWLRRRSVRDRVIIATKVGKAPAAPGLSPGNIRTAIEGSLQRLSTSYVDLYYAHTDDAHTPLHDTLSAFADLIDVGKIRYIAASNYTADRLEEALDVANEYALPRFRGLQPHYNLLERQAYERSLAILCARAHLGCMPYRGLANGFLTGKYRRKNDAQNSPRAAAASGYLSDVGTNVLATLDEVAHSHGAPVAAVALAWLNAQDTVTAPIASARNVSQLLELVAMVDLCLSDDELALLEGVSRPHRLVTTNTAASST